ncbi:hypothetical protein G7046_g4575 [Stylonectria norvegica]|nr:hypothetical protein G7046_g4575 [Stylonectria norvegica]
MDPIQLQIDECLNYETPSGLSSPDEIRHRMRVLGRLLHGMYEDMKDEKAKLAETRASLDRGKAKFKSKRERFDLEPLEQEVKSLGESQRGLSAKVDELPHHQDHLARQFHALQEKLSKLTDIKALGRDVAKLTLGTIRQNKSVTRASRAVPKLADIRETVLLPVQQSLQNEAVGLHSSLINEAAALKSTLTNEATELGSTLTNEAAALKSTLINEAAQLKSTLTNEATELKSALADLPTTGNLKEVSESSAKWLLETFDGQLEEALRLDETSESVAPPGLKKLVMSIKDSLKLHHQELHKRFDAVLDKDLTVTDVVDKALQNWITDIKPTLQSSVRETIGKDIAATKSALESLQKTILGQQNNVMAQKNATILDRDMEILHLTREHSLQEGRSNVEAQKMLGRHGKALVQKDEQIRNLNQAISEQKGQVEAEVQAIRGRHDQTVAQKDEEIRRLRESALRMKADLDSRLEELARSKDEAAQVQRELSEHNGPRYTCAELKATIEERIDTLTRLQADGLSHGTTQVIQPERVEVLEGSVARRDPQVAYLQNRNGSLERQVLAHDDQIASLRKQLSVHDRDVRQAKHQLSARDEEVEKLKEQLLVRDEQIKQLKQQPPLQVADKDKPKGLGEEAPEVTIGLLREKLGRRDVRIAHLEHNTAVYKRKLESCECGKSKK